MVRNNSNPAALGTNRHVNGAEAHKEVRKHSRALIRGRGLIFLGLAILGIFGLLTALMLTLDPKSVDLQVTRTIQELNFGPANFLLEAVSAPGFAPYSFIFPVVIIAAVALIKRFAEAVALAVATVATISSDIMKAIVHRGRPSADIVHVIGHPGSYSFPSGHVTQYTLFFGLCFYLLFTLLRPTALRTLLLFLCGAMVALVGPSRIWMGAHWASDVLGGYTLGVGILLLIIWGYRGWEERHVDKTGPVANPTGNN